MSIKELQTLGWIGGVDGPLADDRSNAFAGRIQGNRLPRRGNRLGSHQNASRPRRTGHRHCGGLRSLRRECKTFSMPTSDFLPPIARSGRLSRLEPAHGRQPLLGDQTHAKPRPKSFAAGRRAKSPNCCYPKPGRSMKKTGKCAAPSGGMAPNCSATAKACSPTATPADWPPPTTAPRWPSSSPPPSRARRCTFSPTKPARSCKARGSRPGNCSNGAST